eukprot:18243_1
MSIYNIVIYFSKYSIKYPSQYTVVYTILHRIAFNIELFLCRNTVYFVCISVVKYIKKKKRNFGNVNGLTTSTAVQDPRVIAAYTATYTATFLSERGLEKYWFISTVLFPCKIACPKLDLKM